MGFREHEYGGSDRISAVSRGYEYGLDEALAQCSYIIGFGFRQCDYAVQKLWIRECK
jgi:hypothetical protein